MPAVTAPFASRVLGLFVVALLAGATSSRAESSFEFQGTATSADPNLFGIATGDPFAITGSYDESLLTGSGTEFLALGAAPGGIADPSMTFGATFPAASPALAFTLADAEIDGGTGIPLLVFDFIDGEFNSVLFKPAPFDFDGQDNLDVLSVDIDLSSGPLPQFRVGIDDEITELTLLQGPVETLEISPD